MIAKPFSPGNAFPAEEVARERITFDKAMIGSCTNGSYDDLLQAALVICSARAAEGVTKAEREFVVFPGLRRRRPADRAARSAPRRRVDRRGLPRGRRRDPPVVVRSVFRPGSGCADAQGQRAITSFNRNWQNRMGLGGEGYLASPAVVAASALAGYMAPPSELGLTWDAEVYRICAIGIPSCIPGVPTMRILLSVGTSLLLGLATVAAQRNSRRSRNSSKRSPLRNRSRTNRSVVRHSSTGVDLVAVDVVRRRSTRQPD